VRGLPVKHDSIAQDETVNSFPKGCRLAFDPSVSRKDRVIFSDGTGNLYSLLGFPRRLRPIIDPQLRRSAHPSGTSIAVASFNYLNKM
jgi:hypothetical protein